MANELRIKIAVNEPYCRAREEMGQFSLSLLDCLSPGEKSEKRSG